MFQNKYTSKTDDFSAGIDLRVLVAGHPVGCLQVTFMTFYINQNVDEVIGRK